MKEIYPWVDAFFDSRVSPKNKEIISRLKKRFRDMKSVYAEIEPQMRSLQYIKKANSADEIFKAIIDGTILYEPGAAKEERQRIKDLKELHTDVIKTAEKLSNLIDRFENKQKEGRFISSADLDLYNLIDCAWGKWGDPPDGWQYLQDFNWPTLQGFLESIILEFEIRGVDIEPLAREDEAALCSQKTEMSFVRYFLARLHKAKGILLPEKMIITSNSVATIANCALNLSENDQFDQTDIDHAKKKLAPFLI